ncbi:retrotransposon protein, putative, ty1-copia subclass, partial [Tanacetum coccineum]
PDTHRRLLTYRRFDYGGACWTIQLRVSLSHTKNTHKWSSNNKQPLDLTDITASLPTEGLTMEERAGLFNVLKKILLDDCNAINLSYLFSMAGSNLHDNHVALETKNMLWCQKASGSNDTFLILYVDDIIIMENHILSLQSVKDYLGKCFAMKDLGEATFILGIKIYRDRSKRLIGLGQNSYMNKILKRYKMDNSKRGHIPMQEILDLNKTQGASTPEEVNSMQNVPYASAVGSIMYVVRCTRPHVAFAQNITSRFQQNPGECHWTAVKNILKYLRNTKDMFLVYGGNSKAEL